MFDFIRIWFTGIIQPRHAYTSLEKKPAPLWGLISTLIRFVGTSLTSIVALALLEYKPFVPSYLTFLNDENYYRVEIFFLPLFGMAMWLLSSALIYMILRLSRRESNIDWIMNVIGYSLLVVMPVVWLLDWLGIIFGFYGASFTIPIHAGISIWEVILMAIGFKRLGDLNWIAAFILGLVVKAGVYIPMAALFVR